MPENLENSTVATDWKRSLFIPVPKKDNAKECSNYRTIALISHASKIMLKFFKPGFSSMWTMNFLMFKAGFRKGRGTRPNWQYPLHHQKSKRVPEKHLFSALLTMPKPLTVWITIKCGKFWKRWEYQTTWPASWEMCRQVRKQQLELDMEQQNGSK